MRFKETRTGITITDAEGNALGVSKKAGSKAVNLTALTRVILPTPGIILFWMMMVSLVASSFHHRWIEGHALCPCW